MYERNAIVLERYFNQMFGYNTKNNLKTNFEDYCKLVICLEKYKNISDQEEKIMQEYDLIANSIREIQNKQETLSQKNAKYQEERTNMFQNIDDESEKMQKRFDNINDNIQETNDKIQENGQNFINIVKEFNDKTKIRTECERARRNIENEYNKQLNQTLDDYKDIDINFVKKTKQFIEGDTEDIEKELKQKIEQNGEREKVPFNENVVAKAITLSIYIQKRESDILTNIYEKTNKLFTEIKNNTIRSDKHQRNIKDARSRLEFINALKEYLIQFLDNERLTAVNGEDEHNSLMDEACNNLEEDLEQINNLYTLLLREISKKITKKSYNDLYNLEYLKILEKKSKEFDNQIKKLNLSVTIINPNYWRIEGMRKIYEVFYKCVTEEYGRDLTEFITINETPEIEQNNTEEQETNEKEDKNIKTKKNEKIQSKKLTTKDEIDRKIDIILGFNKDENEEQDASYEDAESSRTDKKSKQKKGKIKKEKEIDEEEGLKEKIQKNEGNLEENDNKWEAEEEIDEEFEEEEFKDEDFEEEEFEDEDFEEEEFEDEDFEEEDFEDEDFEEEEFEDEDYEEEEFEEEDFEDEDFEGEEFEDEDFEEEDFEDEDYEEEEFEDEDYEEEELEDEDEWKDEEKLKESNWSKGKTKRKQTDEEWKKQEYFEDEDFLEEDFKQKNSKNTKSKTTKNTKAKKSIPKESNWEDEFVNFDKKEKAQKRKGFFEKFKK